ncbi:SDR family NAD(P)-dependent oxidoreductase [Pseudonocardia alni]|uniref:SDR family NAD(P)-dependent oxidoreductase n=1 Tax=Pseudonocardia alni TaxID=33907 RepID=UPI00279A9ADA|nr:SDR family NAD(P)-dependent oxidoreductase [Pseudonocardia alni]
MHFDTTAIVTGGASGLGEAAVRRLIHLGATVAAFDLDDAKGGQLESELGERFRYYKVDVSQLEQVETAVAAVEAEHGPVRVVVNAAAVPAPAKLLSSRGPLPMDVFDTGIKVNLYGPIHLMRSVVPGMAGSDPDADGERGVIINISSGAAYEGQVGQVAYSASKAALVGLTMPLFRELAAHGIRVMTVAPGAFDTPIYGGVPPALKEELAAQSLFPPRMGRPEEFGLLIEEIVRNPMHNGRTIRLDAGMILRPS